MITTGVKPVWKTFITDSERLKALPLTENENKPYHKQRLCCNCNNKFNSDTNL